jgi:hypothetical protein
MTKIFGLCPRCKSRIKINNVERLDGGKIACRDCGYTIRIHAARAKAPVKSGRSKRTPQILEFNDDEDQLVLDAVAVDDDEFAVAIEDDGELPAYQPVLRRTKTRKPAFQAAQGTAGAGDTLPPQQAASNPRKISPLKIVGICVGVLIGFGLGFAGVLMFLSGSSAKFEPPEKYVAIPQGMVPLAGMKPEGWKSNSGGGVQGIPIFITITDRGSISIDIRESEGSSAKGRMKKRLLAGEEVHQLGAPVGDPMRAPPVESTHAYHKDFVMKNFSNYRESPAQPIETGFGEGLISDFTAEEGLFHSRVKGCRASVVHRDHQYNIVCKCPPAQFKDVRPVFEKVIASLNPNDGSGGGGAPARGKAAPPLPVDAND